MVPNSTATNSARTSTGGSAPQQRQQQQTTVLIEQAEAIKASLRDALSGVDSLIRSLKQHRTQGRIVQSALASLEQL